MPTWLKGVAVFGILALLVAGIVALIVELKKKKPTPVTPTPAPSPSPSGTLVGAQGAYGAAAPAPMPAPFIPPVPSSACGCTSGVGYGSEFTDVHPLQQLSPLNMKGCKRADAANYVADDRAVPTVDGCQKKIFGCTDSRAFDWRRDANTSYPNACHYPAKIHGCTDPSAFNYDPRAEISNNTCIPRVPGCTSIYAANFNPMANFDTGECVQFKLGCTDKTARNFDDSASVDDGSCVSPGKTGCTALAAMNFDKMAQYDNGSCCNKRQGSIQCGNPFSKAGTDAATLAAGGDCSFCSE